MDATINDASREPTRRQQCVFLIGVILVTTTTTWADTFPASRKNSVYIRVHNANTPELGEESIRLSNIEDSIDRLDLFGVPLPPE